MKLRASINVKINTIIILSLLLLGGVSILLSYVSFHRRGIQEIDTYRLAITEEKKELLKALVNSAYSVVEQNYQNSQDQESKKNTARLIGSLRFGSDNKNFIYILDTKLKKVLHHPDQIYQGKEVGALQDTDGKLILSKQLEIAGQQQEGFHTFSPQGNEQNSVAILTYVKHFPGWNMAMAAQLSLADIEKTISSKNDVIISGIAGQVFNLSLVIIILIENALPFDNQIVFSLIELPYIQLPGNFGICKASFWNFHLLYGFRAGCKVSKVI